MAFLGPLRGLRKLSQAYLLTRQPEGKLHPAAMNNNPGATT